MTATNVLPWKELTRDGRAEALLAAATKVKGIITARTIAEALSAHLGAPVTRNSVIGFLSRHPVINLRGLDKKNAKVQHIRKAATAPRKRKPRVATVKVAPVARVAPVVEIFAVGALPLWELPRGACKWPVSGEKAATLFCAQPLGEGGDGRWCATHRRLGYQSSRIADEASEMERAS